MFRRSFLKFISGFGLSSFIPSEEEVKLPVIQFDQAVYVGSLKKVEIISPRTVKLVADSGAKWLTDGKLHREDGPAVEHASGSNHWYINGLCHREDGPAVERADGTKEWWLNGKLHREDGPAIERADGTKEWWLNGKLHREDGPAIERADGTKEWWVNGQLIRREKS